MPVPRTSSWREAVRNRIPLPKYPFTCGRRQSVGIPPWFDQYLWVSDPRSGSTCAVTSLLLVPQTFFTGRCLGRFFLNFRPYPSLSFRLITQHWCCWRFNYCTHCRFSSLGRPIGGCLGRFTYCLGIQLAGPLLPSSVTETV